MSNHHYHIVHKGNTLETVAKKYSITAEELRRYHNTYCKLPDLLGTEITHQKELIVPKPKKPKEIPKPKEVPVADEDFMRKMEKITGLTGTALIIYLIISEGSRLFPPRNLVLIP